MRRDAAHQAGENCREHENGNLVANDIDTNYLRGDFGAMQCAQGADECGFSAIAYEFVASALMYYENELADTKQQIRALTLLAGAVSERLRSLPQGTGAAGLVG
jgi:hypothetical protein